MMSCARLGLGFGLLGCIGCSGGRIEALPDDSATMPEPPPPIPAFAKTLRINAYIAWDNPAKAIVDPTTIDGEPGFVSAVVLTLSADAGLDLPDCQVAVRVAGLATDALDDTSGRQWQLSIPGNTATTTTNCPEQGYLDTQYLEDDDALTYWSALTWRFAMTGAMLQPGLLSELEATPGFMAKTTLQGDREGEEPYELGVEPLAYWQGFELEAGAVLTDQRLLAADVDDAPIGELPTGYYVYDELVVYPLPDALVRNPASAP
ncbi:MAG: hypothetical protein AAGA48_20450 [Myxococcota bacterium]